MKDIPTKVDNVGDTFNAEEINSTTNEEMNFVTSAGLSLSGADLFQVSRAAAVYAGAGDYYIDTGTAAAYQLDTPDSKKYPPIYYVGQRIRYIAANTNTGAATARIATLPVKNIKHDNGSNLTATQILAGNFITLMYNGTYFVLIDDGRGGSVFTAPLPPDYRNGCEYNPNSTTPATKIDISPGKWRSSDDTINLTLVSTLIKQINANWAEGDDAGGFPSGLTLTDGQPYHIFLIGKSNGATDAGFDSSLTAVNLLADATGYTKFVRIGTFYVGDGTTAPSGEIRPFVMTYGTRGTRIVLWEHIYTDDYVTSPGTTAHLSTLYVPPGLNILANFNIAYLSDSHDQILYASSPLQGDQAGDKVGSGTPPQDKALYTFVTSSSDGQARAGGKVQILTNISRQIRWRVSYGPSATQQVAVATLGWEE
jgi:hypothetical protein